MRCWPRRSTIRNPSRSVTFNSSRSATRNPRRRARRERDPRQSAPPKSKELAVNLRREAIIAAIDPYAEAPTGNREFFLNKPPILAGNTRAQRRPVAGTDQLRRSFFFFRQAIRNQRRCCRVIERIGMITWGKSSDRSRTWLSSDVSYAAR
jgi:hypothetical protein